MFPVHTVYGAILCGTRQVVYVGSTVRFDERQRSHAHRNASLRPLHKHLRFVVLKRCRNRDAALLAEAQEQTRLKKLGQAQLNFSVARSVGRRPTHRIWAVEFMLRRKRRAAAEAVKIFTKAYKSGMVMSRHMLLKVCIKRFMK